MEYAPLDIQNIPHKARTCGKEIILIEEDPYARLSMTYLLSRAGYAVIETGSYLEAFDVILNSRMLGRHFELLITDMNPCSLDMLQCLRMQDIMLPFVITMAFPDAATIEMLRSLPYVAVLVNPYTLDELLQSISALLRSNAKSCVKTEDSDISTQEENNNAQ